MNKTSSSKLGVVICTLLAALLVYNYGIELVASVMNGMSIAEYFQTHPMFLRSVIFLVLRIIAFSRDKLGFFSVLLCLDILNYFPGAIMAATGLWNLNGVRLFRVFLQLAAVVPTALLVRMAFCQNRSPISHYYTPAFIFFLLQVTFLACNLIDKTEIVGGLVLYLISILLSTVQSYAMCRFIKEH